MATGMELLMGEETVSESSSMPKIPLPSGFMPPDEIAPGEEFDATVRGYVDDSGQFCVVSLNGMELGGEREEPAEVEVTEESEQETMEVPEESSRLKALKKAQKEGY